MALSRGWARLAGLAAILLVAPAAIFALVLAFAVAWAYPGLPSIEALTDYQPKVPLRVYSAEGLLLGEFGEERRSVVRFADVPVLMRQAILAAEDDRFYQHGGVDLIGVARAAISNIGSAGRQQGASTITMQVARNFFISSEKTYTRKFYEALLAFKIEASLAKDKIFEIYINQIFLGQRAYGFASAAQIYFGKPLKDITAAEAAMLAGLPKAPSAFNPVVNPKRARTRQLYILDRMKSLGYLTVEQHAAATREPLNVRREINDFPVKADFVAEMARQLAQERFGDEIYTRGLRVHTTIRKADQEAAHAGLRRAVLDYERRHGYRGPESFVELKTATEDELEDALQDINDSEDLRAAVVLDASPKEVRAYRRGGETVRITGDGLRFVANALSDKAQPNRRIRRGAVVRIIQDDKGAWSIVQMPEVEAAFVSVAPEDGAVRALVGGFDFNANKFNHVTQAWRQPGSSFKPFIYSASLEKGLTPSTVINDAPIFIDPALTGGQLWEPKNYDGKYDGPMRMRTALAKSKNLVSIRILQQITPQFAQEYVARFGFDADKHPPYLTMALGAGSVTPWQMVGAYAVFANGGYRINPYIITRITDDGGRVLAEAKPARAGDESIRVIDPRNAFIMNSMMNDVTKFGTAARAGAILKRGDLAGKTGTTNDHVDAWFAGYQANLVGVAWIGFDQPKKLGGQETGGVAALPIWISYMQRALRGLPESTRQVPEGVINVGGEWYFREFAPGESSVQSLGLSDGTPEGEKKAEEVRNQLF
ncbi:MAG: penicillin-binding protein 1A [Burkholderiales bacterium]|nr:penicillin-binding protein 1A [Burkholderiales bacterium]